MAKNSLRLLYHFDLLCPHSYLGYQLIQKKTPGWRKKRDFEIDFIPVLGPKIFRFSQGFVYDGVSVAKRNYICHELDLIARLYDLKKPNKFYWGQELLKKRSASALLLLVQLKRENPEYFQPFLETFFDEIWLKGEAVDKVAKFFKIGRELGIELRIMDEVISRIEFPENIKILLEKTRELTLADALGTPWIEFGTKSHCFVTNEIMRLEMIDHFLEYPEHLPERRPILEGREFHFVSDKTPCIEDYRE